MNAKHLISKTRNGEPLARAEIDFLVHGAVSGDVPPYQLTAWMMAVYFRGLSGEEATDLTRSMLATGLRLKHQSSRGYAAADKHSTGGVGDKLSFIVAPLVAACGVPVPMISGRSLGHTGGTLDKLESIPGLRTDLDSDALVRQVERIGICIAGQNERLAPADRIFYALRDAASIVESIPLITASILSKKAAAGVEALVLDVKLGNGAFMRDHAEARKLAQSLVATAQRLGIRSRAHLTGMDHLLGLSAGNALEVAESARALRQEELPADLRDLTFALGGSMLELSGAASDGVEARSMLDDAWSSGRGFDLLGAMVEAQGGDRRCLDDLALLPRASRIREIPASHPGFFAGVHARPAGRWITEAGGGRLRAGDPVDPTVGVEVLMAAGTPIEAGDPVLRLHLPVHGSDDRLIERAQGWVDIVEEPPAARSLVLEQIDP